ncbi:putative urea transporter 1 isoform X1 [Penaeus vannamei]|uniref:Putative urea transporter 1 isoform X1 n=1 Tax=Penaeus vannamei TaxID=6689 RepID=A0A3R7SWX4_PENVA|nr:putative urea transporter 1 isoform X1 [Penaeus vannamei]
MQPHITVTGVPGDLPTMKPNGDALKLPQLIAPKFDTLRRPSCLPNDTEFNPRPKVRKTSSHDLSINDTFTTTSFNPSSNSGLSGDIMDSEPPPCLESVTSWVFGDVQYITDFLDRWPFFSFAIPLKLINATLRTMGAPLLLNSPISGSLILVALILDAPLTTCWGLAGLALSIIMALVLKQPQHIVTSGQVTQHGLLLGLLMGRALLHNTEHSLITTGITLALTAPLSVVAGNAMTTWLSQTNLPALTLSYILLGACVCLGLDYPDLPTSTSGILVNSSSVPNLQWSQVIEGTVRGAGQVYGCPTFASSCLILAAILLFSPTMFLQACLGTLVGSLCVLMQSNDLHRVYRGDYGRHSLLTALSLGGFFFVLNFYSCLVALAGAVMSAFIFQVMLKINMPVLTVPHVVATLVLLHTRMRGGLIKRIDLVYLTFPEMHRRLFRPGNAVEDCPGH